LLLDRFGLSPNLSRLIFNGPRERRDVAALPDRVNDTARQSYVVITSAVGTAPTIAAQEGSSRLSEEIA
jgi:hypothetical protein